MGTRTTVEPSGGLPPAPAPSGSTQAASRLSTPPATPAFMNQPTFIQKDRLKFLIFDAPHYDNINYYIQAFRSHGVSDLVRTCERTYDENVVMDSGVTPHVRDVSSIQ